LSSNARLVLYTLKCSPIGNVAGIFVYHIALGPVHSGLTMRAFSVALDELENNGWVESEGSVIWGVNFLKFEPGFQMTDPNKRRGVEKLLASLPKYSIVGKFCKHYGLDIPEGVPEGGSVEGQRSLLGDPAVSRDRDRARDRYKGGSDDPPRTLRPFKEFWDFWTYKTAMVQAKITWDKLEKAGKLPDTQTLMDAVEWQTTFGCLIKGKTKEGRDPRPYPSSWLNGERWNDERPGVEVDGSDTEDAFSETEKEMGWKEEGKT
jgi:hypothetical protein